MARRETMVYADEVAATLGVAKETAYKIIKGLNDNLREKGYVTVSGRLPRRYWEENSMAVPKHYMGKKNRRYLDVNYERRKWNLYFTG